MPTTRCNMVRSRLIAPRPARGRAACPATAHATPGTVTLVRAAGDAGRSRLDAHAHRAHARGDRLGPRHDVDPPQRLRARRRDRGRASGLGAQGRLRHASSISAARSPPTSATPTTAPGGSASCRRRPRAPPASTSTTSRWSAARTTPAVYPASVRDPRTGATMTEAELAALHGRLHGRAASRAPERRARPRRPLGQGRHPRRHPARARRRRRAVALENPSIADASGTTAGRRSRATSSAARPPGAASSSTRYAESLPPRAVRAGRRRCCSTPARSRSATTPGPARDRCWSGYDVDLGTPLSGRFDVVGRVAPRLRRRHRARQPAGQRRRARSTSAPGFADLDGVVRNRLTLAPGTRRGARARADRRPAAHPRRCPRSRRRRPSPPAPPRRSPPRKPVKRSGGTKAHIAGAGDPTDTQDVGDADAHEGLRPRRGRGQRLHARDRAAQARRPLGDRAPRQGLGLQARQVRRRDQAPVARHLPRDRELRGHRHRPPSRAERVKAL